MSDVVKLVTGNAAKPEAVADHLADLAGEWADKPLGTGAIVVVVQKEGLPIVYGYGDCGTPLIELELARKKLFDLLLGE